MHIYSEQRTLSSFEFIALNSTYSSGFNLSCTSTQGELHHHSEADALHALKQG